MPTFSLGELARELGCELAGNPDVEIRGVSTLDKAGPHEISFLANVKYAQQARSTDAAAVIASDFLRDGQAATLVASNPYHAFARALALFYLPPRPAPGLHPTAVIAPTAVLGPDCSLGAYVVVGERTSIGSRAVLHPHAVIYEGCTIGDDFTAHSHVSVREFSLIGHRVTLHNGVVIGGDGFGFAKGDDGRQHKIVQSGRTVLEDDVEIQTLTSVDRATVGETRVKRGVKIDSLCQIGHACTVGEDSILCGQTGLAGSTTLEESVVMAGQTGSAGHLKIGKNAIVWAQSGLNRDVEPGAVVSGYPAFDSAAWLRSSAVFPRLPELFKTVRALERRIQQLEGKPAPKLDESS